MGTRVRVGDVEVRVESELSAKQLRSLLRACAGIHLGLVEAGGSEPPSAPIGFGAHVERAAEPEPESYFTDDE